MVFPFARLMAVYLFRYYREFSYRSLAFFACGSFCYEADLITFDRREMNYLLDGVVDDVREFTFCYLLVIHVKFVG
jgi:hypothetical protein